MRPTWIVLVLLGPLLLAACGGAVGADAAARVSSETAGTGVDDDAAILRPAAASWKSGQVDASW